MSSHYRITFSQLAEEVISFATNQVINMVKKTKAFLKQRIAEDLKLYRQFNQYHGIPVTSFWEKQFGSLQAPTFPAAERATEDKTDLDKGKPSSTDIFDKITPQQALVFNKIRDIAANQGYEIRALPSPSDDLIIDLYVFDFQEEFKNKKKKVFVKREAR